MDNFNKMDNGWCYSVRPCYSKLGVFREEGGIMAGNQGFKGSGKENNHHLSGILEKHCPGKSQTVVGRGGACE